MFNKIHTDMERYAVISTLANGTTETVEKKRMRRTRYLLGIFPWTTIVDIIRVETAIFDVVFTDNQVSSLSVEGRLLYPDSDEAKPWIENALRKIKQAFPEKQQIPNLLAGSKRPFAGGL